MTMRHDSDKLHAMKIQAERLREIIAKLQRELAALEAHMKYIQEQPQQYPTKYYTHGTR